MYMVYSFVIMQNCIIAVSIKETIITLQCAYYKVKDKTLNKITVHDRMICSILEEILGCFLFRCNELLATFILFKDHSPISRRRECIFIRFK